MERRHKLGASRRGCGAPGRRWAAPPVCEPPEGVAARLVAAGPRLLSAWQAQYLEPPEEVAARLVGGGPRLLSAWQAQYLEPPEGGLRRAWSPLGGGCMAGVVLGASWSPLAAGPLCVAGAVFGASRKGLAACCV